MNVGNDSTITVELVPGGNFMRVTDLNKKDFITKKCHFIAYKAV